MGKGTQKITIYQGSASMARLAISRVPSHIEPDQQSDDHLPHLHVPFSISFVLSQARVAAKHAHYVVTASWPTRAETGSEESNTASTHGTDERV